MFPEVGACIIVRGVDLIVKKKVLPLQPDMGRVLP